MTYSLDFRKQVLRSIEEGMTVRRTASFYQISTSTLYSWQQNMEPKYSRKTNTKSSRHSVKTTGKSKPRTTL